jgi:hypothetical protein
VLGQVDEGLTTADDQVDRSQAPPPPPQASPAPSGYAAAAALAR